MDTIESLIEQLSALNTAQIGELKQKLEPLWNVSGSVIVASSAPVAQEAPIAEPTEFVVLLTGFDATKKMSIIKFVRETTGKSLVESKTLVEGALPAVIKDGVPKDIADDLKAKIEAVGGTSAVKPV
jgi:large subunit ribosomal protein L7/L12